MPKYITGLFDEHEFMRQLPPHDLVAYGPFEILEVAQLHAQSLSTDPDEGVVIELHDPGDSLG